MKKNIALKDASVLLIVVTMVLSTVVVTVNADCPDGMISYWKGDGNADDSYGSNDGTYVGSGYITGKVKQGFSFDGNNDYVKVDDASDLQLGTGDFTLEAWIKHATSLNTFPAIIVKRSSDTHGDSGFFFGLWTNGRLFIQIEGYNNDYGTTKLIDNTWHHVAVTRNVDVITYYVDGVLDGTESSDDDASAIGHDLYIGLDDKSPLNTAFYGFIDEAAVYNKCLDANVIEEHYNAGVAGHGYCGPDPVYVDDDYYDGGYNDGHNWGYDAFDNINQGIDAVCDGGTVYVAEGIYQENVVVDKQITLVGENKDRTIIDAGGTDDVVHISINSVNISGFTLQNSGNDYTYPNYDAGIDIRSDNNEIYNNIIEDNYVGIYLYGYDGFGRDNKISSNEITYNEYLGIFLNRYCINNTISNNDISLNVNQGIYLMQSSSNKILDNQISEHNIGIWLYWSPANTISGNIIISNLNYGLHIVDTVDNLIYNNYFDNTNNARDDTLSTVPKNIWNIAKTPANPENIIGGDWLGGNYWSDYTGFDYTGDFLGDTDLPFDCSGDIRNGGDELPLTDTYRPGHTLITEYDAGRVIEVDGSGKIVWQRGQLRNPIDAERLENGNTLIAVEDEFIVIEVNKNGQIEWIKTGLYGRPFDVERLTNENTLITLFLDNVIKEFNFGGQIIREWDSNSAVYDAEIIDLDDGIILLAERHCVREIDLSGNTLWEIIDLDGPVDVERLADGHTLITEHEKNRVIEVKNNGEIEWEMNNIGKAMDAERLENGNTLIVHRQGNRVIEVNQDCEIVWEKTGLSIPMDAERLPVIIPNTPNTPSGATSGKPGQAYDFSTSATHPNGGQLYYQWKWGDGNKSGWLGPYESGETITTSYTWAEQGDYEVRVKAKDGEDIDSVWSDPLVVTMPRKRTVSNPIFNFFKQFPILHQLLQRLFNF